jgi:hypothetical protein
MDSLLNSIKQEVASTTKPEEVVTKAAEPADVKSVTVVDDKPVPDDKVFLGELMKEADLDPITASLLRDSIREIFANNDVDYVENEPLISDVGARIADEVDLLTRIMNPKSEFTPDWYPEGSEDTPVYAVTEREELTEDYCEHLVETYALSENVAHAIVDFIGEKVSEYEDSIMDYYAEDEEPAN